LNLFKNPNLLFLFSFLILSDDGLITDGQDTWICPAPESFWSCRWLHNGTMSSSLRSSLLSLKRMDSFGEGSILCQRKR
jgi:hypothetical protein